MPEKCKGIREVSVGSRSSSQPSGCVLFDLLYTSLLFLFVCFWIKRLEKAERKGEKGESVKTVKGSH